MPYWMDYLGKPALVLLREDLVRAQPLISCAAALWLRDYADGGSVVIGSGIGVLYLPPRCRKPREHLIIPSPGLGDGGRSIRTPLNYLARNGIAAFQIYGRMD